MSSSGTNSHPLSTKTEWTRDLPEAYVPTREPSVDRLAFFHILERLKTQKRTGWIKSQIPGPESIADHMHRMSVLALCTSDATLDIPKCVMMSVVHDLAEAVVGDIAPWEGISRAEKVAREREGMRNMLSDMLHDGPAAKRIEALWECLAASEYEKSHAENPGKLQPFFDSSLPKIQHPEVAQWGQDLNDEREKRWGPDAKRTLG
ncbi:hypothetical protein FRC10_007336 [Ceratobasidium sp. 414]|nr:hypothetical protein FRC10_007336 [Ceratobasidium sp. 414]